MGCAVIASKFGTMMPSLTCHASPSIARTALAWPGRTTAFLAFCWPSSANVLCLMSTRAAATKIQFLRRDVPPPDARDQDAALWLAISCNKKNASKDHGFSSFRSGWLCNRCDETPHIDAYIVQRCGTGIFGDDDEGHELCARDSLAFMDSAHASSFGRRAVFQPQSRDLGMAASPFRGYKASHPKAWRGGVSLFSLFLGLSVWPKWPPVGLEGHWQTLCIMVSGVSTPSA